MNGDNPQFSLLCIAQCPNKKIIGNGSGSGGGCESNWKSIPSLILNLVDFKSMDWIGLAAGEEVF